MDYFRKKLFAGILPANKFAGTIPVNKNENDGTVPANKNKFAGTVPEVPVPPQIFFVQMLRFLPMTTWGAGLQGGILSCILASRILRSQAKYLTKRLFN